MKTAIKSFLSPFFLSRFYIQNDIKNVLTDYNWTGSVIDIGCGTKPYVPLFTKLAKIKKYSGIDFESFSVNTDFPETSPDHFFSADYLQTFQLPFKDNQFDNSVSFQVLEHHAKPEKMISEMVRITKKSGFIMLSFPFIWALHELPHDYFRFTEYSVSNWLQENNCTVVKIIKQGSIFSACSMLLNEEINTFAAKSKLHFFISLFLYLPLLLYQYLCLLLDRLYKSPIVFSNYLILARKI